MPTFPKPIHFAQQVLKNCINKGDYVVDATLGNGHDALFLANLVGEQGHIIGFDIQAEAIEASTQRMEDNDVQQFTFHELGHEKVVEVMPSKFLPLSAVMFNLGYLPNADKSVITKKSTTLEALNGALVLLKIGGVISLMCYPGHVGGDAESQAVSDWASNLPREDFRVVKYALHNAPSKPPFLIIVEKLV